MIGADHPSDIQSSPGDRLHGSEKASLALPHGSLGERNRLSAEQLRTASAPIMAGVQPSATSNHQNNLATRTNSNTTDHSPAPTSRPSTTDLHSQSHSAERAVRTFAIPSYPLNHQTPMKRTYNPPQSSLTASESYSLNRMLDESPPPTTLFVVPGCEPKAARRNEMHRQALKTRMRVLEERIGVF